MKWRSARGTYLDECARQEKLVGIPRKKFALFPKRLDTTNNVVWLQHYFAVYIRHPPSTSSIGGITEHCFETFNQAENADFNKLNSGFYEKVC